MCSLIQIAAQNPIVDENALPGNPSSEWDIDGAGDLTIQGFATSISVNKGQTIRFKIKTNASNYSIDVYRLGYYNGDGARKIGTGLVTATLPQTQPTPLTNSTTGLVDCGNWSESAHWDVPSTAVSGIYIARLKRDDNQGASHIVFIVRDDTSHSDIFFQASDATWQAYNVYGGNSLYVGTTSLPNGHASKVSYNRPFITRNGGGGGGQMEDWLFNAEYPMIRFLERNGYNISYTTNTDVARFGSLLLNHKLFLSVGHDEYWSAEQRANVDAARDAGVNLAFFSGNEAYWKTRWENSTDLSGTPYRTLVCYKEGTLGENVCGTKCDPTTSWTGLWRDGCSYPGGGACKPENALTGQIGWMNSTGAIQVPSDYKNHRFWRHTNIASLTDGGSATLPYGTLGYEWDQEQFPLYSNSYPNGRIILSNTELGGSTHKLSLYRHASGALVFGAGTIQWSWGLDDTHDRGGLAPSQDMQQATVNLFADMGVQPANLMSELVAVSASDDFTAPSITISNPAHGSSSAAFKSLTITGTATDAHVIAGVEVSIDGGTTWKLASGTTSWSYTFIPSVMGPLTIKVRGFDDSGNMGVAGPVPSSSSISINITDPEAPITIFSPADQPEVTNMHNGVNGIELGVRFKSSLNGYIKGLRFYKSTSDVGTHIGSLWDANGQLIAQATFVNESPYGWQEILFSSPVAITANTIYTASYNSPTGFYSETNPYFIQDKVTGPLTAVKDVDPLMSNGLFKYSTTPVFPTENYQSDNYWVDVIFHTSPTDNLGPVVTSTSPADYAINITTTATYTVNFNESLDPATVNGSTIILKDAFNTIIPATVIYNPGLYSAVLTPSSALNHFATYTVTIKSGVDGVKDVSGNAMANDVVNRFSTTNGLIAAHNEGPGGPILVITSASNPFSRYAVEILRAEGLNEFAVMDITAVDATALSNYDVVILGEITMTAPKVSLLTDWVNAGGTLIAFKPGALLEPLMGLTASSGTLSNKYLLVNTTGGPGAGIVNQTMQFHGTANLHALNGATSIATLYSDATTATTNPAVTTHNVGTNGGKAIAFTYDLARSIVYTRQGNPAWAGIEHDGQAPIRSNDLFSDGNEDWVDFNKIAIPQADEQQRLLANIILQGNLHRKPLPRFWYLPKDLKAAVVMTGDDHGAGGTTGRFNHYMTLGPNTPADVANWKAVRGTSYIFPGTPVSNDQGITFEAKGFEIALHADVGCTNFTESSLTGAFNTQLNSFASQLPGVSAPTSGRTHCMPWSDWASHAKVEASKGIRFDVNYYYWPGDWVLNRPGMFTGSGMPMRFADIDGTIIDCYQATTQITDESDLGIAGFTSALLDKAIGTEGYYGVFTANMHTDTGANHVGSAAVINAALARNVPVVSAKQMLTWIDGRNNSSFGSITWNGNILSFTITAASGSTNLSGMLPANTGTAELSQITRNGTVLPFTLTTIKGIQYAVFDASVTASYVAIYGPVTTTSITGQVTLQGRPAAPNAQWVVPVQVDLYVTGNPTPVATYNTTTNTSGQFTISGVSLGNYNVAVKSSHTLRRVVADQTLLAGNNFINFGTLREADATNDNYVTALDFSVLLNSFNKANGDPGFDARADFNNDGFVTALDFSLLLANFNTAGEFNP
jgi:hypothetical protein